MYVLGAITVMKISANPFMHVISKKKKKTKIEISLWMRPWRLPIAAAPFFVQPEGEMTI
jgi:fucose permease